MIKEKLQELAGKDNVKYFQKDEFLNPDLHNWKE